MAKERPILFLGPMVKAILDGRKTMTRRVMKPQPIYDSELSQRIHTFGDGKGGWYWEPKGKGTWYNWDGWPGFDCRIYLDGPYQPGDSLWVRETWATIGSAAEMKISEMNYVWRDMLVYKADCDKPIYHDWRPSIFMPRWASRLTLEIINVRVERLQDISEADAEAEGATRHTTHRPGHGFRDGFCTLWQEINGKRPGCTWADNPFVWVVEFKRIGRVYG